MAVGVFNDKVFNTEVFGKYMETVPRVVQNAFLTAGIFRTRDDLRAMFDEQTGGNFATIPMVGLLGGTPENYDGVNNMGTDSLDTYSQSMIVVGRMHGWKEKDFSYELTRHNFMEEIAKQVAAYWDDVDNGTVLSILKGIFGVSTDGFSTKHTLDITTNTGDAALVGPTTLNTAVQKAAGANKNLFTMAIMHSAVATTLENIGVLEYRKYNDADGIQRTIQLADWNGRTVLIDDNVPTEEVEATGGAEAYTKYTTYILGQNAFDYCDVGAKVPVEPGRDPVTNGGIDMLYTRQRKLFAPHGFSFVQPSTLITSPTDNELETAARWTIVNNGKTTKSYYNTKALPFARIISKG